MGRCSSSVADRRAGEGRVSGEPHQHLSPSTHQLHPAMSRVFCVPRICKELQKGCSVASVKKKVGHRGTPKTPTENPARPPSLGRGWAGDAVLFRCAFPVPPSRMPGLVLVKSARNCRKAFRCCFRCRWRAFGPYTFFKDPESQILPITALTCSRACGLRARSLRRHVCKCRACGAKLLCCLKPHRATGWQRQSSPARGGAALQALGRVRWGLHCWWRRRRCWRGLCGCCCWRSGRRCWCLWYFVEHQT